MISRLARPALRMRPALSRPATAFSFAGEQDRERAPFHFSGGQFHALLPFQANDDAQTPISLADSATVRDLRASIEELLGKSVDNFAVRGRDGVALANATEMKDLPFGRFVLEVNDAEVALCADLRKDDRLQVDAALSGAAEEPLLAPVVAHALDATGAGMRQYLNDALVRRDTLQTQVDRMTKQRNEMERRAKGAANLRKWAFLGVLGAQFGVLFYYVWWVYSWDIMEPFTYFVGLINAVVCSMYFAVKKDDAEYDALWYKSFSKKMHKLMQGANFDDDRYQALIKKLEHTNTEVAQLEARMS